MLTTGNIGAHGRPGSPPSPSYPAAQYTVFCSTACSPTRPVAWECARADAKPRGAFPLRDCRGVLDCSTRKAAAWTRGPAMRETAGGEARRAGMHDSRAETMTAGTEKTKNDSGKTDDDHPATQQPPHTTITSDSEKNFATRHEAATKNAKQKRRSRTEKHAKRQQRSAQEHEGSEANRRSNEQRPATAKHSPWRTA